MNLHRVSKISNFEYKSGKVVYWMSRDQRVAQNWALIRAYELSVEYGVSLEVLFFLTPNFRNANLRHYDFMLKGLQEVEADLSALNIKFDLIFGTADNSLPEYIKKNNIGYLVTDFSPLKTKSKWAKSINQKIHIPFEQVDAHNVIPCWVASDKQEFAARTIRPKLQKLFPEFNDDFPELQKQEKSIENKTDWEAIILKLKTDELVKPVNSIVPGTKAAKQVLDKFIDTRLEMYSEQRNDPNKSALSGLSPYLHFGQISSQYVAQQILNKAEKSEARDNFLEELIVRKELSDNYCFYNKNYDSFEGLADWAKKTLNEHREDIREYSYSLQKFEHARTHDSLWNAAQNQMVTTGKMHGYMRMYWAKKILEWTDSPESAFQIAIYLNDKYSLDGRDPNGYTGIAWSIGGLHDRAWFERPIYGKVRYMNYNGAKRKFDVNIYIEKYAPHK